jgi:hypothetical protein
MYTGAGRSSSGLVLERALELIDQIGDSWLDQEINGNHDNRNQNQDQGILHQTLPFLPWSQRHSDHPPSRIVYHNLGVATTLGAKPQPMAANRSVPSRATVCIAFQISALEILDAPLCRFSKRIGISPMRHPFCWHRYRISIRNE